MMLCQNKYVNSLAAVHKHLLIDRMIYTTGYHFLCSNTIVFTLAES